VDRLCADLERLGRPVALLVNNAGFGLHGTYLETDPGAEIEMIRLNVEALVRLTRAVLPDMVERGSGRILNVGSTASFVPGPLMTTYYATKAFVLSYSDALAAELDGSGVSVTCLCPGPTRTGFQKRAGLRQSATFRGGAHESRGVARAGIAGALAGRRRVIPGLANKLATLAPRLLPRDVLTGLVARIQRGRR
jgi:short-subunit dehydrogenase